MKPVEDWLECPQEDEKRTLHMKRDETSLLYVSNLKTVNSIL